MPLIRIQSLPLEDGSHIGTLVEGVCRDFSRGTGVALAHVSVVWEFFASSAYAVAGVAAPFQPADTHPVLVEILAPDFNDAAMLEKMIAAAAASVAKRAKLPLRNIFVHGRRAESGTLFDGGKIVRW